MYKQVLALNKLQGLLRHKTNQPTNQPYLSIYLSIYASLGGPCGMVAKMMD